MARALIVNLYASITQKFDILCALPPGRRLRGE